MKKQVLSLFVLLLISQTLMAQKKVKDFTLPSIDGTAPFVLSEAKGNYVALHFLLKTECPYCIRHTNDYMEKSEGMENVIQVFIKPDTEEEIEAWADGLADGSMPIYRDADAALAEAMGIPGGYSFHNQLVHYPALVLIDPEGREVYRYIGKKNSDRLSVEKFTEILASLEK